MNPEMGYYALPHDYTAVPITVFNNNDVHDDTGAFGCNYLTEISGARYIDPRVWAPYKSQREEITEPIE